MNLRGRIAAHIAAAAALGPFTAAGAYWLYGWFFDGIRATSENHVGVAFLATLTWASAIAAIESIWHETRTNQQLEKFRKEYAAEQERISKRVVTMNNTSKSTEEE